jgi:hypothetical protein
MGFFLKKAVDEVEDRNNRDKDREDFYYAIKGYLTTIEKTCPRRK